MIATIMILFDKSLTLIQSPLSILMRILGELVDSHTWQSTTAVTLFAIPGATRMLRSGTFGLSASLEVVVNVFHKG
jgi:hypothetical protein